MLWADAEDSPSAGGHADVFLTASKSVCQNSFSLLSSVSHASLFCFLSFPLEAFLCDSCGNRCICLSASSGPKFRWNVRGESTSNQKRSNCSFSTFTYRTLNSNPSNCLRKLMGHFRLFLTFGLWTAGGQKKMLLAPEDGLQCLSQGFTLPSVL